MNNPTNLNMTDGEQISREISDNPMADTVVVYIIDIPYHADRPYEYYLPGEMRDSIQPGVLVEVPFGNGNRRMTAVVYGYGTTSILDIKYTLKPILGVLSDGPILSEEMLELCKFVKDYTLSTYGDAVRTATPQALLKKITTHYTAIPEEEQTRADGEAVGLTEREEAVYRYVASDPKGKVPKERMKDALGFDCTKPLLRLMKAGLVRRDYEIKAPGSMKEREKVEYTGRVMITDLKSETQRLVCQCLDKCGPQDYDSLAELCEMPRAKIRTACLALQKKDGVTIEVEPMYRNRFTTEQYGLPSRPVPEEIVLSEEQTKACRTILSLYDSGLPKAALLHGVTGSGKTNVILSVIDRVLADGKSVIMLVPEIALTPQTVGIFLRRYGDRIAVLHSALPNGERLDAWRRIKEGLADVVIGTRSAVFAPVARLGMIILDEEHEYTYKSDSSPRYHVHDVARFRCREHNAVMLLASATPSVTSYYKAKTGVYTLVELKNRYGGATLPEVIICDMRGSTALVSNVLAERLRRDKAEGNQSILFLNRRGYNNYVSCRSCGKSLKCPHCTVTMTYHRYKNAPKFELEGENRRDNGYLVCHMCGYRSKLPEKCPECAGEHFLYMGSGTQKVEDDIAAEFRDFRVIRMDLDTTQGRDSHEELLAKFREGEADILLGTQMVTKGHDFPKVSTVGVLNADSSLFLDDYRASERTFAMLTQVAGRAGRGEIPGCAVIQTSNPDNDVLALAARQDYETFYNNEIRIRKALCFPPFCDIAAVTISSSDEGYLGQLTVRMKEQILQHINEDYGDVPLVVYGPFEAPVYRVQNVYRMRFIIKCRMNRRTRAFLSELMCEFGKGTADKRTGKNNRITVSVDLNPSTV